MRTAVVVLVLAGLVQLAPADPISVDSVVRQTRDTDPAVRLAMARKLAKLSATTPAIEIVKFAVIADDEAVRMLLLDTLVAGRVLPPAGRVHVPTLAVLAKMLPRLLPKRKAAERPDAKLCSVVAGTERAATLQCTRSRCDGVMHVTESFEITTGVRWTIVASPARRTADGSCGDLMLLE